MRSHAHTSPVNPKSETTALTGKAKADHVARLLAILKEDLKISNLNPEEQAAALEKLKIYGRDPKDAQAIFTKNGIEVLTKYGLEGDSTPGSLEALRCLANAMLLDPKTRQTFVNLGYAGHAAKRLKIQDSDNEFLISRILFLTTYESDLDFGPFFEDYALCDSINSHIARHAEQFAEGGETRQPNPFDQAALSESLKLLFNLSNYYPKQTVTFKRSIDNIFKILNNITIPNPPLQPPINYLINALVNLDTDLALEDYPSFNPLFPSCGPDTNIDTLITILSRSLSTSFYNQAQLELLVTPLITLLRKIYAAAPAAQKQHMQSLLLPSACDRDLPLGQTDTLPSRLLRLSTSPTAPNLREGISSLLFELSDEDPNVFVQNVGYGFAAGFIVSRGIPVPEAVVTAAQEERREDEPVNPVTGQKLSKEDAMDTGPEMSEEEKEREAERLFTLFERLRQTGVVSMVDPVREAVERGDFEEKNGGGGDGGGGRRGITGKSGGGRVEELDDGDGVGATGTVEGKDEDG